MICFLLTTLVLVRILILLLYTYRILLLHLVIRISSNKHTYQTLVWPWWCVGWYDTIIHSRLVWKVHFNYIFQDSLYHNMDMGTVWHCALVSWNPITVYKTGFGVCAVLVLSVIMSSFYYFLDRVLFHHDFHQNSCDYYRDISLCFLRLSCSGSANAQHPGCFRPGHYP